MISLLRQRSLLVLALVLTAGVLLDSARAQAETPNLNGLEVRCCVLLEVPYVTQTEHGYDGLAIKYLRDLERDLNFTCSILEEFKPDEEKYKGFTGLTRYFNDCAENGDSSKCKYDMAISGFAMTAERLERVDFPAPYAFDSFSAVQRLDGFSNRTAFLILFAPFDPAVWCGVLSIMLTHTIVTLFDVEFLPAGEREFESQDHGAEKLSTFESIRRSLLKRMLLRKIRFAVFDTLYAFIGSQAPQAVNHVRRRSAPTRQRASGLLARYPGLFLIICYEAALVVQLFADLPVSTFRSIEDVKNCRIDATEFCIPSGGATQDYWFFAVEANRSARNCRKGSLEEDQPTLITSGRLNDPFSAGLSAVRERKCNYFFALTSTVTVAAENEHCNVLSVVGESFFPVPISFVLPRNSGLTLPISTATLKFQLRDSLPTPIEFGTSQKCESARVANKLNWDRMKILFYVTWASHIVMLIYNLIDKRGKGNKATDTALVGP